jgi:hypothetical protein
MKFNNEKSNALCICNMSPILMRRYSLEDEKEEIVSWPRTIHLKSSKGSGYRYHPRVVSQGLREIAGGLQYMPC